MNKRIKKLANQAGFIRFSPEEDPDTPIDWSCDYTAELDKFAELIVRECAKKANAIALDTRINSKLDARKYVGDSILKTFGVE